MASWSLYRKMVPAPEATNGLTQNRPGCLPGRILQSPAIVLSDLPPISANFHPEVS